MVPDMVQIKLLGNHARKTPRKGYMLLLSAVVLSLRFIVVGSVGIQLLVMMLWLAAVQGTDSTVGLLSFK